jgi:hypothetical protein
MSFDSGIHCFTWSFTMAAVLSFCACIFNMGLLQGQKDKKKRQKEQKDPTIEL